MTRARSAPDLAQLVHDVEWAFARGLGPRDLVPMLERVIRHARFDEPAGVYARRRLAPLLAPKRPWRAAMLARELLQAGPDAEAYAALGLAYSHMGHFHCAVRAYRAALELAPGFAECRHNLGHLLDVALGRPREALSELAAAHRALPEEPEIASSYAHALAAAGRLPDARRLLALALGPERSEEVESVLARWLTVL